MSRAKVNFDLPTGIENLDITVQFTSKIYPVIFQDALGSSAAFTDMRLWPNTGDALDTSATLASFTLNPALNTADAGVEALTTDAGVTSIFMVEDEFVVKAADSTEAITNDATLTSIELETALVSFPAKEAIGSTAGLTSIALE